MFSMIPIRDNDSVVFVVLIHFFWRVDDERGTEAVHIFALTQAVIAEKKKKEQEEDGLTDE